MSFEPIPYVAVSAGDFEVGWTHSLTDEDGYFEILGLHLDSSLMKINGISASIDGRRYPVVTVQLHEDWIVPGQVTTIPEDKFLPEVSNSPGVDLGGSITPSTDPSHPASEGWQQVTADVEIYAPSMEVYGATDPLGNPVFQTIYAEIQAGSHIRFPSYSDPVITVTQIPVGQLPHNLPDYLLPESMVTFQPGGTVIDPPARVFFGDTRDFATRVPDMNYTVWSLKHSLNQFVNLGEAQMVEGPYGPAVTPVNGGLAELGWHGPFCDDFILEADMTFEDDEQIRGLDGAVLSFESGGVDSPITLTATSDENGHVYSGVISGCGVYVSMAAPVSTGRLSPWLCANGPSGNYLGSFHVDKNGQVSFTPGNMNPC